MYISQPPDVEGALASFLGDALGVVGIPGRTPPEFPERSVQVVSTGGSKINEAIYSAPVSVDLRISGLESEAIQTGNPMAGMIARLGHTQNMGEVVVTRVELQSLPYLNPDPLQPKLHRVTVNAVLTVKGHLVQIPQL